MGLSLTGYNRFNPQLRFGEAAATPQPQEQTRIAQILSRAKGAGHGLLIPTGNPNAKADDVLAKVRAESYAHIVGHEQAHQSAAGSLGGGIHIDYNQDGVAVSGHVPIRMPGLDPSNPEATVRAAQTVRAAALAPGDPSGQDVSVASQAQALMGKAQVLMAQKRQKQS